VPQILGSHELLQARASAARGGAVLNGTGGQAALPAMACLLAKSLTPPPRHARFFARGGALKNVAEAAEKCHQAPRQHGPARQRRALCVARTGAPVRSAVVCEGERYARYRRRACRGCSRVLRCRFVLPCRRRFHANQARFIAVGE